MDVSIIYVNYKTASLVLDSIKSVQKNTKEFEYEFIVVDNASGECDLELIRKYCPQTVCVQAFENLGFERANNLGLEYASGEYIFFLNPDTVLRNNAIDILCRFMKDHPSVGACGGNLYDEKGNATTSFSRKYPSFLWELLGILYIPSLCFSSGRSLFFNHEGKPIKVASVTGADLMVRRSVLSSIGGGFDADFFMNYEETELCLRIHQSGWDIYSVPSAQITHLEGRASYIKQSRLYFLYEGQYIYFRKVYGISGCRLIFAITQLKSYIRILQFLLLGNSERRSYWKMKLETNRKVWNSEKIKRILK